MWVFGWECANILIQTDFLWCLWIVLRRSDCEMCSMNTAGMNDRCEMSRSVSIIPPRLIVAHSASECQTKAALQRARYLARVSGNHMSLKKCAPKVWENVPPHNDALQHLDRGTVEAELSEGGGAVLTAGEHVSAAPSLHGSYLAYENTENACMCTAAWAWNVTM